MLRRPPTVLTLTSEDVKAYEDRCAREELQQAAAAQRRRQQLMRDVGGGMDMTGITTSSEEECSDAEASYHPGRYQHHQPHRSRAQHAHVQGGPYYDDDEGIFHNEGAPYEDVSEDDEQAGEEGFLEEEEEEEGEGVGVEDEYMAEPAVGPEGETRAEADMDLDAVVAAHAITLDGAADLRHPHDDDDDDQHHLEPPPAPSRVTRSTRSTSREPSSSQQQPSQQQHPAAHATRFGAATARGQTTHRRVPSGRGGGAGGGAAAAEAVTPTPVAQAQRDAAERVRTARAAHAHAQGHAMVTPEARTTRNRDERIGLPRGGRR